MGALDSFRRNGEEREICVCAVAGSRRARSFRSKRSVDSEAGLEMPTHRALLLLLAFGRLVARIEAVWECWVCTAEGQRRPAGRSKGNRWVSRITKLEPA
jgi:hypothetical protein